ncbi:hypothetical protein J7I98_22425 [Streptomyces sp. ISL-98]|uniref:hypothetical protein n=1 Tax=Streptomyces sp. ISL-98 TaxID=2819192 RepID=UPI001BE887DB|nr:hypothetical protein [Streptomyces sp. ISL-98]MBT2508593.1 hypothetical protein [Streptomyces sp. ISL-98]
MPSLIEALETRQAEVLGQVERLREQIAGLSEELSRAEERLSRSQITRETVEAVLAAPSSPVPGADGAGGDAGGGVAAALVKAEAELDVTAMSPEYRAIIGLFATSEAAMRCKEVCRHLGLGTEPRHVEGMRSKLKRHPARGQDVWSAPVRWRRVGQGQLLVGDTHSHEPPCRTPPTPLLLGRVSSRDHRVVLVRSLIQIIEACRWRLAR